MNTPDYVAPQDDAVEVQQYSPAAPDTVKVIEHPWAFREDGNASVSVVVVRGDTLSNRYQLWMFSLLRRENMRPRSAGRQQE